MIFIGEKLRGSADMIISLFTTEGKAKIQFIWEHKDNFSHLIS